jgi:hypothetical protein
MLRGFEIHTSVNALFLPPYFQPNNLSSAPSRLTVFTAVGFMKVEAAVVRR